MRARKAAAHHRPARVEHRWFSGILEHDELQLRRARLKLKRGCVRTVDEVGAETTQRVIDVRDPTAALWANVGDRLMLFGPKIDEIVTVEVITVYPAGDRMYVAFRAGEILPTTTNVKVIKLGRLK